MEENVHIETTEQSWGSRILGSITGVLIGVMLILASIILLWWNEGRAINSAKKIDYVHKNLVKIDSQTIIPQNNNKLVYTNGLAESKDTLIDEYFNIKVNAIALFRDVEVYQWKEVKKTKETKKIGGGTKKVTTYSYTKHWSKLLINSDNFKKQGEVSYRNPTSIILKTNKKYAKTVILGAYSLPNKIIKQISSVEDIIIKTENISKNFIKIDNILYKGKDFSNPEIGDLKVSFKIIENQNISILAQQVDNTFSEGSTPYGEFYEVRDGTIPVDNMIASLKSKNTIITWLIRFGGFVLSFFAIFLIFRPLTVIADIVPFLGNLLGVGVGLVAFLLSVCMSFFVIGLAWIFYRPFIGIPLVILTIGFIVYFVISKKSPSSKNG